MIEGSYCTLMSFLQLLLASQRVYVIDQRETDPLYQYLLSFFTAVTGPYPLFAYASSLVWRGLGFGGGLCIGTAFAHGN